MISVNQLNFSYSKQPFIKNVTFDVNQGEIFGFLGPSGAGKSTLQKILTGIIRNFNGEVIVNDVDMQHVTKDFYETIGVDFEFPSLYEKLTAMENLKYFQSLYKNGTVNIVSLLEQIGLINDANKKVSQFSKGMKSRLNFIKSILHDPEILFLDEPTSGLDPVNSKIMKNMILEEKKKGKIIILTTHNMVDATQLCDRVAFIIDGQIKALDTPHNLIMSKGANKVVYSYIEEKEVFSECLLEDIGKDNKLLELIKNNQLRSIHSSEPTLNDIFMEVTGRNLV